MTQPTSLNQTFDTSLIDTHQHPFVRSFSSTETDTSGSNQAHEKKGDGPDNVVTMSAEEPYTAVSNAELYDAWAGTYDTDGNVLQAIDDLEMERLLPELVRLINARTASGSKVRVLDLGCGTGRNTLKLLQADWSNGTSEEAQVEIHGWDASAAMLALARQKCSAVSADASTTLASLQRIDFATPSAIPTSELGSFDAVISTLVLEHLPLDAFFNCLASLLKPGGYALVTNMHPEMGRSTRAGYKTSEGGRVKGESWVYGVQESLQRAERARLRLEGSVWEREVDAGMIERGNVGERGRKWVGVKVWYGFLIRKAEQ